MMGLRVQDDKDRGVRMDQIWKSLRYSVSDSIIYEENGVLIILITGCEKDKIRLRFKQICENDDILCAGMGTLVHRTCDIHCSYEAAQIAYQLTKTGLRGHFLDYDELGVYKILSDIKNSAIYPAFVEETLGPLLKYDTENGTDYVHILETYFENECNGKNTAEILYFHKNTMMIKLNKIKEILGYDMLKNENRTKIMISFYIIRLGKEYFSK